MAQNIVLCLASLYFFSTQENAYLPILLLMIAADYGLGWLIFSIRRNPSLRDAIFYVSVFLHVLTLVLFGGSALADYFAGLIGQELAIARTPGMLYTETSGILFGGVFGVLFYTLHGISYLADIYRRKATPEKNPVNVAVYLSMFPLMVVGPVQVFHKVKEQLHHRETSVGNVCHGILRTGCGLLKIILFGIPFRELFRTVLSEGLSELPFFGCVLLWFAFFLSVYYLFTGCSDMAHGMSLMLGFEFEENYDSPCISLSVTEYWKRWNVSFTQWFREYIYFPLGGNHCDRNVQAWNLFLTWVCFGLWHGFSVNTLMFGVFFGLLTVAEFYLDHGQHVLPDFFDIREKRQRPRPEKTAVRKDIRFQFGSAYAGQFTFRPENFKTNTEQPEKKYRSAGQNRDAVKKKAALPKTLCRCYVIFSVAVAWLLLMFETPEELVTFLRSLLGRNGAGLGDEATIYYIWSNLLLIFVALVGMTPVPRRIIDFLCGERQKRIAALATVIAVFVVSGIGLFTAPEIFEEDAQTNRFYCKITTYISYLTNRKEEKGIYFGDDGYLFASHKSWLVDESVQEENLAAIAEEIEAIRGISLAADGEDESGEAQADGTETTVSEEAVVTDETETTDTEEAAVTDETETTDTEEAAVTDETDTTGAESDADGETASAEEISVSCILVPSASCILSDELPMYAPEWDEGLTEKAAKAILGDSYISCMRSLKNKKDEEIYYHSEEGVTSLGAYYVYATWARAIGLEPSPCTDRSMKTVYDSFYGSLARTLRLYPEADSILRYRSFRYTPVTVQYSDGTVAYSLFEEKYLGTKQELSYYLNGTQDIVRITTGRNEGNDLLVITDDSGRRYAQFFVENFHTITIVNINEYEGSITELAEECGAGEVLFLFEMSSVYAESEIAEKLAP